MRLGRVALLVVFRRREPCLGPVAVLGGRDVLVLRSADESGQCREVARRVAERPEAPQRQLEQPLAQEDHLLRLREHAELRVEPRLERRLAQHAVAEGVERGDRRLRVAVRDQLVDALGHLGRGLLGEREREDLLRARALRGDQVGDAPREDGRLAGAGARDDEQRALAVDDGLRAARRSAPRGSGPRRSEGGRQSRSPADSMRHLDRARSSHDTSNSSVRTTVSPLSSSRTRRVRLYAPGSAPSSERPNSRVRPPSPDGAIRVGVPSRTSSLPLRSSHAAVTAGGVLPAVL